MKEYQIKVINDKKVKTVDVALSGRLNIVSISDIQKDVNSAIKNSKIINVKITDVDDADLSLIQLMVALRATSQKSKVEFNIELDINSEISELFKRAGFSKTFE